MKKRVSFLERTQNKTRGRSGFILPQLMIAFMIVTIVAVFAGGELVQKVNDGKARETGRYLIAVRGALVDFQIRHEAFLRGINISAYPVDMYPSAPSFISWSSGAGGVQYAQGSVQDLIDDGHLKNGFSLYSPFGERAEWIVTRSGVCDDTTGHANDCLIDAYVYTCYPISDKRSTFNTSTSCGSVPEYAAQADASLIGEVILHTDGYGGTDLLNSDFFLGSLIGQLPRDSIPGISSDQGRVVVAAGLNLTPFSQFIRQGDIRHVYLNDNLTVEKKIESKEGIIINSTVPVVSGNSCADKPSGLYATTTENTLAVCLDGNWFGLGDYLIRNTVGGVINGQNVPPVYCPAPMESWQYAAIETSHFRITGSDIDIKGSHSGTVSGSGSVNQSGAYNISGSFSGGFQSTSTSYIDSKQGVSINSSGLVTISPNGANARAFVVQGCKTP